MSGTLTSRIEQGRRGGLSSNPMDSDAEVSGIGRESACATEYGSITTRPALGTLVVTTNGRVSRTSSGQACVRCPY